MSQRVDIPTAAALGAIAYVMTNVSHEVLGHCGVAAMLGSGCRLVSSTNIPLVSEPALPVFRMIAIAGSAATWLVGGLSLLAVRSKRSTFRVTRVFWWLLAAVSLITASTYLLVSPLIGFGDWNNLVAQSVHKTIWRVGMTSAGFGALIFSMRVLSRSVFPGASRRAVLELIVSAYLAGGIVSVLAGTRSDLPQYWAQLQAAGGTFGLTAPLLLFPWILPTTDIASSEPLLPRSSAWIFAGSVISALFIYFLGPGVELR